MSILNEESRLISKVEILWLMIRTRALQTGCDKGREDRGGKVSKCGLGGRDSPAEGASDKSTYKQVIVYSKYICIFIINSLFFLKQNKVEFHLVTNHESRTSTMTKEIWI